MIITTLDWTIIGVLLSITLIIGFWVSKQSGKSSDEYFLSGRNMPWWLLGISMVATTFSTDTPNLVTDMVRQNGVSGNWAWWVFLLTGMLTVFVYAKLWRRSNVTTDIEFYELRYSGPAARFLRGFRALFLGLFFNVLAMSAVSLAAIKIGGTMLGLAPIQAIRLASEIGMLTVFVYAKLWRRSNVTTDIEFYELRYSGPAARFLRGFRALFLGLFFNVLAMSAVSLAAIKIGGTMLGLTPIQTIGIASVITVVFSSLGGFKGVVYTDFILFFVAMVGAIGAAYYAVQHPDVGSLQNLFSNPNVADKLNIFPDLSDRYTMITLFIIPFAVQWWNSWYPGAEPGGGGYIAQRMLASKDENHAIGATFFFNALHYALRPWPWIIVALCSLVVFPDLESIQQAFPNITPDKLGTDQI